LIAFDQVLFHLFHRIQDDDGVGGGWKQVVVV
jgi:hypothetical protein